MTTTTTATDAPAIIAAYAALREAAFAYLAADPARLGDHQSLSPAFVNAEAECITDLEVSDDETADYDGLTLRVYADVWSLDPPVWQRIVVGLPLDQLADDDDYDPTPCCIDPGCNGSPCTFPGYADDH